MKKYSYVVFIFLIGYIQRSVFVHISIEIPLVVKRYEPNMGLLTFGSIDTQKVNKHYPIVSYKILLNVPMCFERNNNSSTITIMRGD